MTDATPAAQETPAPDPQAEAAAAKLANLTVEHEVVSAKLDDLRVHLGASLDKATSDPAHTDYTEAFQRDVALKVDEIIAWIKRHL